MCLFGIITVLLIVNFFTPYQTGWTRNEQFSRIIIIIWLTYVAVYKAPRKLKAIGDAILSQRVQQQQLLLQSNNNKSDNNYYCDVIHVGFVCSGYKSNLYLHTLLKSILFYRLNPIHFHLLVNKVSEKVLRTLFTTWNIPQSKCGAYYYYLFND